MEKGEDVILFVYPINYSDIEDFKTDSYQLLRAWQGKLLFNEEYGVYAPYIPENELPYVRARSYTLEEFEDLRKLAEKIGITNYQIDPLVRSSYKAAQSWNDALKQ